MTKRSDKLASLRQQSEVQVLIIGAGVNGIGTFRDLALQGVDVLMVDKGDFCSGASMASSHMLHGGIRYLENGEFRLVREALRERNRMLKNAPHLTQPLPTAIPIFKLFSGLFNAPLKFVGLLNRPAERGAIVIKLGMMLYDLYVRGDSPMPGHKVLGKNEVLKEWPHFNPDIRFVGRYYDAAMPAPERICIEMIADASHAGARALNYVSAVGTQNGAVTLRDEFTGDTYDVTPQIVINAAGPWIDFANKAMGEETQLIGGTKGSHIIVEHPALRDAINDHEVFFEYHDGRIVFVYPYQDKAMIGSTDIRIDNPDDARCTDEEIDYILGMVPKVFPDLEVTREHIIFQFSGVRPLPYGGPGFTGQISRDHSIEVLEARDALPFPVLNLIGGKWTTFRAFAEQTTDAILARLGINRQSSTSNLPIGGGKDYPGTDKERQAWITQAAETHGIPIDKMASLFARYGTNADTVAAYIIRGEDAPLAHSPDFSRGEIRYLVELEQAAHIDDLVLRRTKLAWTGQVSADLIAELAEIMGEVLSWNSDQQLAEVDRTKALLADQHGLAF